MKEKEQQKLIMAVLNGEDYEDTIHDLTQNGFFVTVLNSSGGFFRKKNVTIMIGTDESKCAEVLEILKGLYQWREGVAGGAGCCL